MAITEKEDAFVDPVAESIAFSQMFTVAAAASNPAYLVLTVLDRDEYTAGASGATGTISGNGRTLGLSGIDSDARSAGIVFTYQASSGRYYNSIYGFLDQITYNASGSAGDVTDLSLFGTNNFLQASAYASNAYDMMTSDPAGYLGTATVVTEPGFTGSVPAQATPGSIAAIAETFIGQAWNMDGCWILASTIAAEAGAALPSQSTLIGLPGQSNGEWIVAFNGPAGQSGDWESMVHAGEIIDIGTSDGGGHITTCVAGSGSTAMLVDNITYVNGAGQVQNLAGDGSSSDVVIAQPHAASQEWAGVQAASVVIYELDTPVVTAVVGSDNLRFRASQVLSPLFSVSDPAARTITEWQVYDTASSDALVLNGTDYGDHSAASALTASSLTAVSLLAGATATTDILEVRAFNGSYWGDWTGLTVAVSATTPVPVLPPVLAARTSAYTWKGGSAIALALPAGTFSDPEKDTLTYAATLAGGGVLPSWLVFNAATETFTGVAPTTAQSLSIVVTATDAKTGLSATDTFTATVIGLPQVTAPTPNQAWTEAAAVTLALPANTFTDPQGQALSYTAKLSSGLALPGWLKFNSATETFSGTAPTTASTLSIAVTATDTSGLSASETFTATVQPPAPILKSEIVVTAQTPSQTWTDGAPVNMVLPSNTFTDALGLRMTFAAYQVSGPDVTSWLFFNPTRDELIGNVPPTATGTVQLEVIASDFRGVTATDLFSVTFAPATGHAGASALTAAYPSSPTDILLFHA